MRLTPANAKTLLMLVFGLGTFGLVGCQAERSIMSPAEPEWSYHNGSAQLSNNDAWNQMVPASAMLRYDSKRFASSEDPTVGK